MPIDYKLCPKCNNALDNNMMECPYCGEKIGMNFGVDKTGFSQSNSNQKKQSGGCGCVLFMIWIFMVLLLLFLT